MEIRVFPINFKLSKLWFQNNSFPPFSPFFVEVNKFITNCFAFYRLYFFIFSPVCSFSDEFCTLLILPFHILEIFYLTDTLPFFCFNRYYVKPVFYIEHCAFASRVFLILFHFAAFSESSNICLTALTLSLLFFHFLFSIFLVLSLINSSFISFSRIYADKIKGFWFYQEVGWQ